MTEINNITCDDFNAMPEAEQMKFVVGVCNGRGMTIGLFDAYAGAAQEFASSPEERESIAASYRSIRALMNPMLTIDPESLLNGIRVACRRPEFRDQLVINALASVHLGVARALRENREQYDS